MTTPHGVALDPIGNFYVMDAGGIAGDQRIVQEIIGGTSSVVTTPPYIGAVTLGGSPSELAVDNSGNLLVADFGGASGTGQLTQINVGQPSLSFPSTPQNSSSSAMTVTVKNLGDQSLVFSANPTYTAYFSQDTSDRNNCNSDTRLTVGLSCDVSVLFTPQSTGNLSTNITVTGNTQNVAGSTQQISASGTGTQALNFSTTTMVTFSPPSSVCGQSVTLTATVFSTSTPSGTVAFTTRPPRQR